MAKTKTKMELVSTEETQEFKKRRMKEVRSMVSAALKHNQRIDLMDWEGTDIARVMVALQDEVMNSRSRHQKATKHIAESKQIFGVVENVVGFTLEGMGSMITALGDRNQELEKALYVERQSHMQTAEVLDAAHQAGIQQEHVIEGMKATIKELS
ncbi:hypothetical protein HYO98_gp22 [Dinoroseobacter phage DS-1410Ws-06]|uniref:Uncharacterized protein n=1 Tax=Dinoroseobacter phage DS-1410Ws-06 TaxID=1815983 RepID=A0A191VY89_9CAUD|nr:hypothetical protein HYO98_gp22 [Dinoroseobacter phage DS-1410Ws-06]ANJ20679.1 hypothetical protein DSp06_gp22 [Dinoroseobacter phage DS-1410Ws-06]